MFFRVFGPVVFLSETLVDECSWRLQPRPTSNQNLGQLMVKNCPYFPIRLS